jgi:hypothetical protein
VGALGAAMQLYMHVHMDENFKEAKEQKILRRLTFFPDALHFLKGLLFKCSRMDAISIK